MIQITKALNNILVINLLLKTINGECLKFNIIPLSFNFGQKEIEFIEL